MMRQNQVDKHLITTKKVLDLKGTLLAHVNIVNQTSIDNSMLFMLINKEVESIKHFLLTSLVTQFQKTTICKLILGCTLQDDIMFPTLSH